MYRKARLYAQLPQMARMDLLTRGPAFAGEACRLRPVGLAQAGSLLLYNGLSSAMKSSIMLACCCSWPNASPQISIARFSANSWI